MLCERRVRIIKRDQRGAAEGPKSPVGGGSQRASRGVRTVVSGWVREHGRRTEEYRLTYVALLGDAP